MWLYHCSCIYIYDIIPLVREKVSIYYPNFCSENSKCQSSLKTRYLFGFIFDSPILFPGKSSDFIIRKKKGLCHSNYYFSIILGRLTHGNI